MNPILVETFTLWADHFRYTREFIQAAVSNSPHVKKVETRLLRNQKDLGDHLTRALNWPEAGRDYHRLLKEHIVIAGEIVTAALAGQDIKALNAEWNRNGDAIGVFLHRVLESDAPVSVWTDAMRGHLKTTLAEAVALIQGKDGIVQGDRASAHVNHMAMAIATELAKYM
jgi:hypothetical protein